ncbi:Retrovirus-related Pol polyprotein from transposon RE1 [Vitis vinifera]|uniref:Retrovirus-related Pol polyprotein from transposon RE1 n=1 Tax=Vitis vinifera TaxID=29760 RepID=A0A438IMX6_VITVI|nr:Retrovirus-related Pol polyprotein from transposon RE1 [Vitis vinifera]
MINANPNLIRVVVKHSVFKDTLPNDARCFSLSLINNPRHLVLKALRDIVPPHPSNHEPIMLFLATNTTPTWLLDSGASHHVTSDLSNLYLHSPYQGSDDVMIGHGSTLLPPYLLPLAPLLYKKSFVKDLNTGTILLMGEPKDGIYEWPTTFPFVTSSPLPAFSSVNTTLSEWHSRLAMNDEFNVLVRNGTWELVSSTFMQNLVGCKWVFRIKQLLDGSVDRYKAKLVAKGFHQRPGVDYHDTFSLVVKLTTIRLVLSLTVNKGTNTNIIKRYIYLLTQRFSIKDLGVLSYFLGSKVLTTPSGMLLTQRRYIFDLLAWTKMFGTKPVATPLVIDGNLILHLDADWAGNKDDYTSTSAYIVYLGHHLISWSSKKLRTVAWSSTKAKYRSVAATTSEINWICSLFTEFGITLSTLPVIYCDNVGVTYLCSNPVFHWCMKHVAIDYHFIWDQVQSSALCVTHVSSADQLVNALTKLLPRSRFQELQIKIGVFSGTPS